MKGKKYLRVEKDDMFDGTTRVNENVFEIIRVNKNTYTCKMLDGFMKNCQFKLKKEALNKYNEVN